MRIFPTGSSGRAIAAAFGLCAALCATSLAHALSIGEVDLRSRLGEPLRASVPLTHLGKLTEHDLSVGQATDAEYRAYGLQHPEYSGSLKFAIVTDARGTPRVQITSDRVVNEPLVDILLVIRWPTGHAVKQFTLLLDPPAK